MAARRGVVVGRVRARTITFQPTADAREVLEAVMARTGKSQSDVLNEALEKAGPVIVREFARKREALAELAGVSATVEQAAGEGLATAFLSLPEMKRKAALTSGKSGGPAKPAQKSPSPRR